MPDDDDEDTGTRQPSPADVPPRKRGANNNQRDDTGPLAPHLEALDEDGRRAVMGEVQRLRNEARNLRKRASLFPDDEAAQRAKDALAKLDEIEQQGKTEAQQAAERLATTEKDRDGARRELWRERAGRTHKLSDVFTASLVGDTEEEITEHARQIAEELESLGRRPGDAVPKTPASKTSPGAGDADQFDAAKIAEQAISRM